MKVYLQFGLYCCENRAISVVKYVYCEQNSECKTSLPSGLLARSFLYRRGSCHSFHLLVSLSLSCIEQVIEGEAQYFILVDALRPDI